MPNKDHPWYGGLRGRGVPSSTPYGLRRLKDQPRTISDELVAAEIARVFHEKAPPIRDVDGADVRDPSYAPMGDGAAHRRPVRYE